MSLLDGFERRVTEIERRLDILEDVVSAPSPTVKSEPVKTTSRTSSETDSAEK
jgi:hypothetical protein